MRTLTAFTFIFAALFFAPSLEAAEDIKDDIQAIASHIDDDGGEKDLIPGVPETDGGAVGYEDNEGDFHSY